MPNWELVGCIVAIITLIILLVTNIVVVVRSITKNEDKLSFLKEEFEKFKKEIIQRIDENHESEKEQIERLERKQDRHNGMYENTIKALESAKAAHHRIDEMKGQGRVEYL